MKTIRYEFITEEIVEIEISDEWGEKLKSVKREQWKLDKREERHSVNFADLDGKEEYFADSQDDPFAMIEEERYRDYKADHERRIVKAFSELSGSQRELLKALYEDGMTETEYAIRNTKVLVSSLSAGGIICLLLVLICILFGTAFYCFGDESSSNYTPVSEEVEAYSGTIAKYANQYGIGDYTELIKAVMMQESGGRGSDPMQASESGYNKKYSHKPNSIKDPEYSIECGVQALASALSDAKCKNALDMNRIRLALQGYNYGNGYISWAIKRDGGYTVENASDFSDEQAKKHGWKSYGDKQYPAHVLRYYPYGNYNYGIGNGKIMSVAAQQLGNAGGKKFWSYMGFKSRVEWCACFVSWCSDQCGYVKAGIMPKSAGVGTMINFYKGKNEWQKRGYKPSAGDVIFFDWEGDGGPDHVGLVEKCDGANVYTIEGNSSDACRKRTYSVNSKVIYGYGVLCD